MEYLQKSCTFTVAYDEVDFKGRLKPSALLEYFQDIVEIHAFDLNITHDQMEAKGKFWVMTRIAVEIDSYPKVGAKLFLTTYPHKPGLAEAYRSYYIADESGDIFVRATTKWCVLDMKTKRICKCRDLFDYPDEAFMPEKAVNFATKPLSGKTSKEDIFNKPNKDFRVNITDLDENLHMNNARYCDTVFNSCDFVDLKENQIQSFDISYMSELKYNDTYKTFLNRTDDYSEIDGFIEDKQAFSAFIKWKK